MRRHATAAGAVPDVATAKLLLGKSGLPILQAMLTGELPSPHIMQTKDHLLKVDKGLALFQGVPQPMHHNPRGSVHGGWHATLSDSALGCAVLLAPALE